MPAMKPMTTMRFLLMSLRSTCERFVDHRPAFAALCPAPLMFGVERGNGVEVEEVFARLHGGARKDGDTGGTMVSLEAVYVAFAAAAHGVDDEVRGIEAGGGAADMFLQAQRGVQRGA